MATDKQQKVINLGVFPLNKTNSKIYFQFIPTVWLLYFFSSGYMLIIIIIHIQYIKAHWHTLYKVLNSSQQCFLLHYLEPWILRDANHSLGDIVDNNGILLCCASGRKTTAHCKQRIIPFCILYSGKVFQNTKLSMETHNQHFYVLVLCL